MAAASAKTEEIRVGPIRTPAPRSERRRDRNSARWLRIALPLTAVGIVAALFLSSRGGGGSSGFRMLADQAQLAAGSRVVNPRFVGSTEDGSDYSFQAAEARPDGVNPNEVELDAIQGALRMQDGRIAELTAAFGLLTRQEGEVRLYGGVAIVTSDGYKMEADELRADTDTREVVSDSMVVGGGPVGQICAQTMRLRETDGGVARFDGDVVVVLRDLPDSPMGGGSAAQTAALPMDEPEMTLCQRTLRGLEGATGQQ